MSLLKFGSRGPEVATLQRNLNLEVYPSPKLVDDGIFGTLTKNAVIKFQGQSGLKQDGMVGPATRAALGMPDPGKPFTHRIGLHFRSISLTNVPFNTILAHTQLVYAQYGIKVEYRSGMSLMLSEAETEKFDQIDGTCNWEISTGEYADLLKLGGNSASEITVFFIDKFSESINGCGGHLKNRPACIVAKAGTKWCTAHEVCHVLLGSSFTPVHISDPKNLMHPVDLPRSAIPTLTAAQVARIKESPICKSI